MQPKRRSRLLFRLPVDEQVAIQRAFGPTTDVFLGANDDAACSQRVGSIDGMVVDVSSAAALEHLTATILRYSSQDIPILLRVEHSPSSIRQVLPFARRANQIQVSLRGFDDLIVDIRAMRDLPRLTTAEQPIITRLLDLSATPLGKIAIGAALLGKRRRPTADLARFTYCAERTLEWRLRRARGPQPQRLLAWMTSLHTMWRLEVHQRKVDDAARDAGFSTGASLSNFLFNHLGVRSRSALQLGGFWYWLDRLAVELGRCSRTVTPQHCGSEMEVAGSLAGSPNHLEG